MGPAGARDPPPCHALLYVVECVGMLSVVPLQCMYVSVHVHITMFPTDSALCLEGHEWRTTRRTQSARAGASRRLRIRTARIPESNPNAETSPHAALLRIEPKYGDLSSCSLLSKAFCRQRPVSDSACDVFLWPILLSERLPPPICHLWAPTASARTLSLLPPTCHL